MSRSLMLCCAVLASVLCSTAQAAQDQDAVAPPVPPLEPGWRSLFNGKDLDGWVPKITGHDLGDNFGNTFRVEDGVLKVVYDQYEEFGGRFGHLFFREPFSHYRLRLEYRFLGEQVPGGPGWAWRNSGIMVHGQAPESMARDQDFPVSIEVQLLGGPAEGTRHTANVCTPGTHIVRDGKLLTRHCTDSTSETYRGDRWVSVEVEVRGDRLIRHLVEGKEVLRYTGPQLDDGDEDAKALIPEDGDRLLRGGFLSLQSESHPVEFRNLRILVLEEEDSGPGADDGGDGGEG